MKNKWLEKLIYLVHPQAYTKKLLEDIREDNQRYEQLRKEFLDLQTIKAGYEDMLQDIVSSIKAMTWAKDAEHRYTGLNHTFCTRFFGLPLCEMEFEVCLDTFIGCTDDEIIRDMHADRTNNSMLRSLSVSDRYMEHAIEPCHFIMGGSIDDVPAVFYIVKTSRIKNGEFMGCTNVGWDLTSKRHIVTGMLRDMIQSNEADQLLGTEEAFCYCVDITAHQCTMLPHACFNSASKGVEDTDGFCVGIEDCEKEDCVKKKDKQGLNGSGLRQAVS